MRTRPWPYWFSILYVFCSSEVVAQDSNTCSGTVVLNATKQIQYLTTPNYGTSYKYPPFLDCKFLIKAPDKARISIEIIDMEMEPRIFDDCSDYVGFSEENVEKNISTLTTLCEDSHKRQFLSASNAITVIFHTDQLVENRGARLSYRYYDITSCPPDWTELSNHTCVRIETNQKLDWIGAQKRCLEQQSNLITFSNIEKANELQEKYESINMKLWIGNNDALVEGKLVDFTNKEAPRLSKVGHAVLIDNNEDNDCMVLQFQEADEFRMDQCQNYNGYICEMEKNGSSVLYPPPVKEIQEGTNMRAGQYTLWLLLFLIGILFLTVLAFLCFMCWKHKEGARIHTESTTIQQNAFMSDSSQRVEHSRSSAGASNNIPVSNDVNRTSRSSPVTVPIENNTRAPPKKFPMAPVPNRLPMNEEISGSEPAVETAILGGDEDIETVSAAPKPQPRTLPPMPAREGTFHSINTREGSTMRTRRNKELFERPVMNVLDNVSAISLDEFWSNKKS
ncbi:hypothetical protein CAEBREN_00344 [Caenorhabditis brenneri]|uniref:Uncharacterized protein n=1 Tax=Caenorhabditis brenneri TaxID=135651 RepID=G0M768_CAEBE|nr:hypothetical protein CAEBREN_00344 [Caenorhabditis brenneri]